MRAPYLCSSSAMLFPPVNERTRSKSGIWSQRTYSTPLLTDCWEGLDWFFDTEHDLRVVTSADDVEAALMMSDSELRQMAQSARHRTLQEHTGEARARQLLRYFEEARSASSSKVETSEVA